MTKTTSILAAAFVALADFASAMYSCDKYPTNPQAPVRMEFGDFAMDQVRLDLFYHTLVRQQRRRETGDDPGSYYQISSIHGSPRDPWDGITGNNPQFEGFCYHDDPLFAVWHRPYVAVFEKSLRECCRDVVNEMKQRTNDQNFWGPYDQACQALRMPYWDWAKREGVIPPHCQSPRVRVMGTDGNPTVIDNPLYTYRFQRRQDQIGQGAATYRSPNADTDLYWNRDALKGAVAALFRWDRIGTVAFGDACSYGQEGLNSIENIHGWIHVWTGGYMADISAAGYDPVFMMHHCMIDHLIALWQAMNPNSWFTRYRNPYGSWAQGPGVVENSRTPMKPFRKQDGSWWTPDDCRDHTVMGSTYDSFLNDDGSVRSADELYAWIQGTYGDGIGSQVGGWNQDGNQKVKRGYGGGAPAAASEGPAPSSGEAAPAAGKNSADPNADADADTQKANSQSESESSKNFRGLRYPPASSDMYKHKDKLYSENGDKQMTWHNYHAHYNGSRKHIPCSYTMHAFLGKPTETDPKNFPKDPAFMGSFPVFSKNGGMDMPASGSIPMTDAINQYVVAGKLKDASPESVKEFVKKNMQWRVTAIDGKNYNVEDVLGKADYSVITQMATDNGKGKVIFGEVKNIADVNAIVKDVKAMVDPIVSKVEGIADGALGSAYKVLGGILDTSSVTKTLGAAGGKDNGGVAAVVGKVLGGALGGGK